MKSEGLWESQRALKSCSLHLEQLLSLFSALQTSRVLLNIHTLTYKPIVNACILCFPISGRVTVYPRDLFLSTWRTLHGGKTKHTSWKGLLSVLSLQKHKVAYCYFKSATSTFCHRFNLVPRSLVDEAVRDYQRSWCLLCKTFPRHYSCRVIACSRLL